MRGKLLNGARVDDHGWLWVCRTRGWQDKRPAARRAWCAPAQPGVMPHATDPTCVLVGRLLGSLHNKPSSTHRKSSLRGRSSRAGAANVGSAVGGGHGLWWWPALPQAKPACRPLAIMQLPRLFNRLCRSGHVSCRNTPDGLISRVLHLLCLYCLVQLAQALALHRQQLSSRSPALQHSHKRTDTRPGLAWPGIAWHGMACPWHHEPRHHASWDVAAAALGARRGRLP